MLDELRPLPPGLLALADQGHAAARDAIRDFDRVRPMLRNRDGSPYTDVSRTGAEAVMDGLSLFLSAASVRQVVTCEHVRGAFGPGRSYLTLGARWWGCADCGPLPKVAPGTVVVFTDDRCDLCDEAPADNRFWAFASTVAGITVRGDAGSCCVDLIAGGAR
jgi:hypothetical protein